MFEDFYGFDGKPFQLTPDPEFYFRSITHRKALSYLGYGLAQAEGFIVITGEIGSGKSTLVAHMMRNLDPAQVTVAQVVTSRLDENELVHVVARAFDLEIEGHDKASALSEIEAFLHDEAREGRRCLLVVDESQNLSVQALEELRMLSNFQLGNYPLLQVLLLGQPEFRAMLQNALDLEQLRQRVIAAHHLEPMQEGEIEPYVTSRLEKVGWNGSPAFDQQFFIELYEASGGIPRRVNQIANRVLLLGAVERRTRIDAATLHTVLAEMEGEQAFPAASLSPEVTSRSGARSGESAGGGPPEQADQPAQALDPQLVEDLLSERDARIAQLEGSLGVLTARMDSAGSDEKLVQLHDQLAERNAQIGELQEAVVELAGQLDAVQQADSRKAIAAMGEQLARLEARSFEQERTIRQTLSMLIEWIEGELDESKAA